MKRIPENVLFLTMAVIRRGKKQKRRLEILVMGHYKDPQGHSCIDHQVFPGPAGNLAAGAWAALNEWARETGLAYTRDDGAKLKVQIVGIQETAQAAEFRDGWTNTYILRPVDLIRSSESETGFMKFRYTESVIEFSTKYYESLTKRNTEKINSCHDYLEPYSVVSPWTLMLNYCLADFYRWQQKQKQHQPLTPIMETAAEAKESEAINSMVFYPEERVHEIFARLKAARGKPNEAVELRIFAERMKWLYEKQSETNVYWLDTKELIRLASYGEAAEDAARTERLKGILE